MAAFLLLALPAQAGPEGAPARSDKVAALLEKLAEPGREDWRSLEQALGFEWARSGSAAMDLLYSRAMEAMGRDDLRAAADHLGALTDHAPDFAEGWHARGALHFRMGLPGLAISDLGQALRLNPDNFMALVGLALILEELDRPKEALGAWRAAARISPNRPDAQEAIARLDPLVAGPRL